MKQITNVWKTVLLHMYMELLNEESGSIRSFSQCHFEQTYLKFWITLTFRIWQELRTKVERGLWILTNNTFDQDCN